METPKPLRVLRLPEASQKTGLRRSSIYNRLNPKSPHYDASFPKPIPLGNGKLPPIGFVESEIDSWIAGQIIKSRQSA